ncbi:proton channel otopetrin-like a isoform X3 [Rhodnius prolixus]|uniref:proton channel otopetrin-like a isoform X3 n=1 Tax=Rhodnius prolixus TaxID=13249 RepID=UPI003D18F9C6
MDTMQRFIEECRMQRCPYLHEMKERLLTQSGPDHPFLETVDTEVLEIHPGDGTGVPTIVKLNSDGYGSHTSPSHHLLSQIPDNDDHHDRPKNAKTSLFIIMSFIYAKLLVVICIAYVVSEVVTHSLPLAYYEGFFTYLYGVSILFLLYVFCFLLQESTCCQGSSSSGGVNQLAVEAKPAKPKKENKKEKENKKNQKKENKEKKEREKKEKKKGSGGDEKKTAEGKEKEPQQPTPAPPPLPPPVQQQTVQRNPRSNIFQNEVYPRKMRDVVRQKSCSEVDSSQLVGLGTLKKSKSGSGDGQSQEKLSSCGVGGGTTDLAELETGLVQVSSPVRKRKTSQNTSSHGSFFLRVGAIAFGLATMIYNGLEFGAFFEIPFNSPCYQILRGVNPVLQMIFTFMQMYFIFMNSRLNIHRFKVVARFGLMHIVATNLCVWIRTLVLESLKEISVYLQKNNVTFIGGPAETPPASTGFSSGIPVQPPPYQDYGSGSIFSRPAAENFGSTTTDASGIRTTTTAASVLGHAAGEAARAIVTTLRTTVATTLATTQPTTTTSSTTFTPSTSSAPSTTASTTAFPHPTAAPFTFATSLPFFPAVPATTTRSTTLAPFVDMLLKNSTKVAATTGHSVWGDSPSWDEIGDSPLAPAALVDQRSLSSENCDRINIMGTIVQDSAPYLFPFIIEYSLIGAAVIYVMWRHIGKNPRYTGEDDLEHRLEVILSRRAVAMAHAQQGARMDCVGASKGLFLGLLLLVASLICLILFFVLIHNEKLNLLAIYLADVSHCALMALSIVAIIIGFIRVQSLKFRGDEQSDLNDILLRVSAFGLFVYAVFSVIAGSLTALVSEPNLLVMITGILSIFQVVLQLLFISDVSRRRVHLPEHDRSKPGRQVVTFLLIANVTMWIIYTFEIQKVVANPVQLNFYGFLAWSMVQRVTLPLCIFHRFHSAVTLAEIWKTSYKPRID